MALLAEGRRKQKLSVDPRGLNWSQDDSKFGQKMLEKFGWSQGKGLGAEETGRVEHVKLNFKNDTRGVGFSKKEENNWIPLQDEFSDLLATLNANHGQGETSKEVQVQSLEERSKTSKGRLHYQKFTRGKDLSNKNSEDLQCIFGRTKSRSAPVTPQNLSRVNSTTNSAENSDNEESLIAEKSEGKQETEHGVTTISSSMSVQDYFKQKMAQLQANRANQSAPNLVSIGDESSVEEETKERKKGKKSKKKDRNNSEENLSSRHDEINPRKRKHHDDDESERPKKVMFTVGIEDSSTEENEVKSEKKKKKKKRSKEKSEEDSQDEVLDSVEMENDGLTAKSEKRKKKKKKSKEKDREDQQESDTGDTETVGRMEIDRQGAEGTEGESNENGLEEIKLEKKKKKKKKSKRKETEESGEKEIDAQNSQSDSIDAKDTTALESGHTAELAFVPNSKSDSKKEKFTKGNKSRTDNIRKDGTFPGASLQSIKGYGGGVSLKNSWNKTKK